MRSERTSDRAQTAKEILAEVFHPWPGEMLENPWPLFDEGGIAERVRSKLEFVLSRSARK
jgi:hypothetical protein